MREQIILLLIGAGIGLFSSLLTILFQHWLTVRKEKQKQAQIEQVKLRQSLSLPYLREQFPAEYGQVMAEHTRTINYFKDKLLVEGGMGWSDDVFVRRIIKLVRQHRTFAVTWKIMGTAVAFTLFFLAASWNWWRQIVEPEILGNPIWISLGVLIGLAFLIVYSSLKARQTAYKTQKKEKAAKQSQVRTQIKQGTAELNFKDKYLAGISLSGLVIKGGVFWRANLCRANLQKADLTGADFSRAIMTHIDLLGATLCQASFYGADLNHARLEKADLTGANLREATLKNIRADKDTIWPEGWQPDAQ